MRLHSTTTNPLVSALPPQGSRMKGEVEAAAAEVPDVSTHLHSHLSAEDVCLQGHLLQAQRHPAAAAGFFAFLVHRQRAETKKGPRGVSRVAGAAAAAEGGEQ